MPSRFFGTLFVVLALVSSSACGKSPTSPSGGGSTNTSPPEKPPWEPPPAGSPWGMIASIGVRVADGSQFGAFFPPEGLKEPANVKLSAGFWVPVNNRPVRIKQRLEKNGVVIWTYDEIATQLLANIEQYFGGSTFGLTKAQYRYVVETWDQTAPAGLGYSSKEEVFIVK